VIASGEKVLLGGYALEYPGYDLVGAFVGSEGTLGVVTSATLRLLRAPEKVRTLLAGFPSTDAAGAAVSSIIARGIVPAAIEMMDELAIEAAERAVACGYPRTAAVLIVELDGSATAVDHDMALVQEIVDAEGAVALRHADDAVDRAAIWRGRKSAFAAVGRISPDYYVQDGVVPRTALPEVLRRIGELAQQAGLRVANVFHAGDGNLHPLVLYDASVPGESERGAQLSSDIVELCVSLGGSITGEHGVGLDKVCSMPKMFSETDLEVMQLLRDVFDADRLCNPGKLYPTPGLCGEKPGPRSGVHPLVAEGLAEMF
jgi:glycolate oxidase